MRFEIDVDDEMIRRLVVPIATKLANDEATRAKFGEFALRQVLGWMTGTISYQSLTQQHTEWLTELLPVFFAHKPPTATQIFNSFSVPYGRASYISRVLMEKQQTIWRERGRQDLLAALGAKNKEAQQNVGNQDGLKYVQVPLNLAAHRELFVLLEDYYDENPERMPALSRSSSPGRFIVDLPSMHFAPLIGKLS